MNTLSFNPILPQEKSRVLFSDGSIDFGFPEWQYEEIVELWNDGKSIMYIAKSVKRHPHEVFLALYEAWMNKEIKNIERAFTRPSTLLVPGRKQKEG